MSTRRIIALLVVVLAVAVYVVRHRPAPQPPVVTDQEMVLGSLRLLRCPADQQRRSGDTYCTTFWVPERWDRRDQPAGRRIGLRVQLVRSDAPAAASDLVVMLAGGPGQSATESFDTIAAAFDPVLEHRHVLLVDQRGTGGSNALVCTRPPDEQLSDLDQVRARTKACLAQVEKTADPRYYTTTDAVEDLEALRLALGSPRFDLVGISYGTRVAQQYVRRHPGGVRSIVLDGVVPNAQALGDRAAADLEAALRKLLALCTSDARCKARYGDPWVTLTRVRPRLRARPRTVEYRDPRTFVERTGTMTELSLIGLVRLFAYSTETSSLLPLMIDEADHDRYAPLLGQASLIDTQLQSIAEGMALSVLCAEDVDLLVVRPGDPELLLGDELVRGKQAECEVWPHGTRPADFHTPVHSDVPSLLLSGELDPVTPPANAEDVMRTLSNARHLVARGNGHNSIVRGCMPRLVAELVEKLDPKGLDASCTSTIGPIPAFTSFDGASP
ncbi:MAG: alpha/beta fold hydrolase [Polyangia bacterium]